MMKHFIYFFAVVALCLVIINVVGVQAGEPTGKIGPMNPTMFKCVLKDNIKKEIIQPDPWLKFVKPKYTFIHGGEEYTLEGIEEILREYPDAEKQTCVDEVEVDYGFNPRDSQEFSLYLRDLEEECREENEDAIIVPIEDTRIEGVVYEFHPRDRENPAESEWFSVPSKSVMIRAKGITFEIYWGSGEEGGYLFQNLGAGPIVLDLQLPPDAHALNPGVVIFSNGLEETWTVFLGFYRGDIPPPDIPHLRAPDGNFLPFITLAGIEDLSMCGYTNLPEVIDNLSKPPTAIGVNVAEMPNVGRILPQDEPNSIVIILAVITLVVLPTAGIFKLHRNRSEEIR